MDEQTLLIFISQILRTCSWTKTQYCLEQLKDIMNAQGDTEKRDLVTMVLDSIPEVSEVLSEKKLLNEADLQIAKQRSDERRRREELMRSMGRC